MRRNPSYNYRRKRTGYDAGYIRPTDNLDNPEELRVARLMLVKMVEKGSRITELEKNNKKTRELFPLAGERDTQGLIEPKLLSDKRILGTYTHLFRVY
jgi:hypothetical protein